MFLRGINLLGHLFIFFLIPLIIQLVRTGAIKQSRDAAIRKQVSFDAFQAALNMAFFPVLFFFSALFYTDVLSTYSVLVTYTVFLCSGLQDRQRAYGSATGYKVVMALLVVVCGLISLTFRQTNVFWVAVFLGGLELVRAVHGLSRFPTPQSDWEPDVTLVEICQKSWYQSRVYDPLVAEASLGGQSWTPSYHSFSIILAYIKTDYFKTGLSLAIGVIRNIKGVSLALIPYVTIIAVFGIFVAWNGGVVLGELILLLWHFQLDLMLCCKGDKSNHVATLHLSQMLYIWPYMVFFSWPVLLRHVLRAIFPSSRTPRSSPARRRYSTLPSILTILIFIPLMLLIVHFNTLVHPFTLADNRHYMFYVFRWIILRHWLAKYLAVPVYFGCAWAVITGLGTKTENNQSIPLMKASATKPPSDTRTESQTSEHAASEEKEQGGIRTSFVLVWLVSTTLSLVTAPLVEPRYFILPWLFWRLNLPPPSSPSSPPSSSSAPLSLPTNTKSTTTFTTEKTSSTTTDTTTEDSTTTTNSPPRGPISVMERWTSSLEERLRQGNNLYLETIWFLIVNMVTGYIFLYKGFSWPQEEGKVQRFMW